MKIIRDTSFSAWNNTEWANACPEVELPSDLPDDWDASAIYSKTLVEGESITIVNDAGEIRYFNGTEAALCCKYESGSCSYSFGDATTPVCVNGAWTRQLRKCPYGPGEMPQLLG